MRHLFRNFKFILFCLLLPVCAAGPARANPPQTVNFQARLTDLSNNPLNGPYDLTFSLYNVPTGGAALWTELQPGVSAVNGAVEVVLGSVTPIQYSVAVSSSAFLEVKVGSEVLSPRQPFNSVLYSMNTYQLAGRTYDAFVDTFTAQTITGVKTFSSNPVFNVDAIGQDRISGLTAALAAKAVASAVAIDTTTLKAQIDGISGGSDNLGNHVATTTLNMANFPIINVSSVIAVNFIGNGSGLTGISGASDNLGNHTATQPLNMAGFQVLGISSLTVTGQSVNGYSVTLSSGLYMPLGTVTAGLYSGSGAMLTGLNAGNLAIGTVPDARLSANIELLSAAQAITGIKTFTANPVFNTDAIPQTAVNGLTPALAAKAVYQDVQLATTTIANNLSAELTNRGNADNLLSGRLNTVAVDTTSLRVDLAAKAVYQDVQLATSTLDSSMVKLTGTQTIAGDKTFANPLAFASLAGVGPRCVYADDFGKLQVKSGDCGLASAAGDNLGDHSATQNIKLNNYWLSGDGNSEGISVGANGSVGVGLVSPSSAVSKFDVQDGSITVRGTQAALVLGDSARIIYPETSAAVGAGINVSTNVHVAGFISAAKYVGDGSGLTGITTADNLGNHIATTTLLMGANQISGGGSVTMSSYTATGGGISAALLRLGNNVIVSSETSAGIGGGVRISTNVYIVGFSSASKYFGDGSGLTGITGGGDNLGSHIATTTLKMSGFNIVGVSSISVNVLTTDGSGVTFSTNVYVASGRVGIGTIKPLSNLHIVGVAEVGRLEGTNSAYLNFHETGDVDHGYLGYVSGAMTIFTNELSRAMVLQGSNAVQLGVGSQAYLTLNNTGNVGIGTTAPAARLDVVPAGSLPTDMAQLWRNSTGIIVSSVSATGVLMASKFVGDGSGLTGLTGGDVYKAGTQIFTGANTFSSATSFTAQSAVLPGVVISSGLVVAAGNVGIGTAAPAAKLDVRAGGYSNNQNFGIQIGVPTGQWLSSLRIKSDATGVPRTTLDATDGTINGTTNEALSIIATGNVGIGTTAPAAKLEVTGGAIKATGGFILETRTADPTVPETGQMWLRID